MKIAVCFKIIADYNRISDKDWIWNEEAEIDISYVRSIFNCFEESALETALKISDSDDAIELTALTVDDQKADLFLKQLTAVGYQHAVRIDCGKKADLRFNPLAVSHLIASYIKAEGIQLVILGMQGGDGDNRQTGFLTAERLGYPCIRNVCDIKPVNSSNLLRITNRTDGSILEQTAELPLVLTMSQSLDSPFLRVPNLKQKLAAKTKLIKILTNKELGVTNEILSKNDKTLVNLQHPDKKKGCVFIEAGNEKEQAQMLYDKYLKSRLMK